MARAVEIRLLGPPRIAANEEAWTFNAPPKTLPLLAYVILHRGASLRRENAAFALWPDDLEDDARANLRRHMHRLAQALPPHPDGLPWLATAGAMLRWDPSGAAWTDVGAFDEAIRAERFEDAADLYRGDLLDGYEEPWLEPHRTRLRAAYCGTLERLAQGARSAGAFADVVRYADRLLAIEPWREDALRWGMSARYELGDRAGALAQYEAFTRRLDEELGAETSAETRALHELIARHATLRRSEAIVSRAPAALPFVGRAATIASIMSAWHDARDGRGSTLLVGGDAGSGKSRLVAEIATRVNADAGRVLVGVTPPQETRPYHGVVDALRQALPALLAHDVPPHWLGVLSLVLPDITARWPSVKRPGRLDSLNERRRLFDAIGDALTALARVRPVMLAIEDVHWAGADTLDLIDTLARRAPVLPLLLVATYRDQAIPATPRRSLRRLVDDDLALTLPVGPLAVDDVREVAAQVFGDAADVDGAARRLFAISGGNALFLSEAVRTQLETRESAVPATLMETIAARIRRLPEGALGVAQAAAAFGGAFDVDVLREAGGWHEHDVIDALDVLIGHGIVRAGARRRASAFAFTHDLIRAAIENETPSTARAIVHRRIARALERLYPEARDELAAELATHYERAGMASEAADRYATAARRANDAFANDEAIRLATAGLAVSPTPAARFTLLALREETRARIGDRAGAAADLEAMRAAAEELDDDGGRCDVLVRDVAMRHLTGDVNGAEIALAELREAARRTGDPARIAVATSCAARHVRMQGRTREAIAALREALAAYASIDARRDVALVTSQIAEMHALSGDAGEAEAAIAQARALASSGEDWSASADVLASACRTFQHLRRYEALRGAAAELLAVARKIGDAAAEAQALTSYGTACVCSFDLVGAEEHYHQAAEIHARSGNRLGAAIIASNRAVVHSRVGRWDEARELAASARAAFGELGDVARELAATCNEAQACVETGDAERGLRLALRARDLAVAHGGAPLESAAIGLVGVCLRALGRYDDAIASLRDCIERERSLPNATEPQSFLAVLALAYVDRGDVAAAVEVAAQLDLEDPSDEDLGTLTEPQLVPWAAFRAYAAAGDDVAAARALARASAIVARLEARLSDDEWRLAYRTVPLNRTIMEVARDEAPVGGA